MGPVIAALSCCSILALVCILLAHPAAAQDTKPPRLIDQPPFDVLTLDKANDNQVLHLYPVNLPNRQVPKAPRGTDRLKVRLLDTGAEYEVAWSNIAKLELYEERILAEANQLTADGKYDEAYDYFVFLLSHYPKLPDLAESRQGYLYQSAGAAFREQRYDEALAVLEELLAQNSNYRSGAGSPSIRQVLGNIADRLLAGYVQKQDYRAARTLLDRLSRQYQAEEEPFAKQWRQRLTALAEENRQEAQRHMDAGRYVEAFDACRAMERIWPDLPGAAQIIAEVSRRHPLVTVGVEHPALDFDSRSLHNVSARRAGRLTERLLMEQVGLGTEGGQYACPLGTVTASDDGLQLLFNLSPDAGRGLAPDLAQQLLALASPTSGRYQPAWGHIVSAVRLQGASEVRVDLSRPHVLPEALLQMPLVATGGETPSFRPFHVLSRDETRVRFAADAAYALRRPGQPAEVVERNFEDPQRALLALRQGEIDILDRVFPGDVASLKADERFVVAPYQTPTTHVVAVRSDNPLLGNRSFRRALLYGSNRELLLAQGLLGGKPLAGFRVVSGPFPAPVAIGDTAAYAYDRQIDPLPYDPRLALTLRLLAEGEVQSLLQQQKQQAPKLGKLVLGHPADEVSRIACRGLERQWKLIGVECSLEEFPPGVFDDAEGKCDLVYLQLAAWEPIVDARRLLGPGGLTPAGSPPIQLALRQIERARNWREAHQRLLHLHRLLHEDVTLLPLWQTMDHFAYRRTLAGLAPRRLRLYQDVEQWQAAAHLAGTTP